MIQESDKPTNDIVDMIIEGCQSVESVKQRDGTELKTLTLNPKKVWLKTNIVNSPNYGRYTLFREMLENKAGQCFYHMSQERASIMARQIVDLCDSYDYSIDAKSSEILRDKNNTQSNLIDKINRNKIERQYTIKDAAKQGIMDGFLGRKTQTDAQQEN